MEQRGSTPLKHHSETANPNVSATQTCHFHETLRLCSEMHHLSCMTYHFYANHNAIAAQTDTWHVHEKSRFRALPNGSAIGAGFEQLRTRANGCERLRTRKQRRANTALPSDSQVKREPFATHSGKTHPQKQNNSEQLASHQLHISEGQASCNPSAFLVLGSPGSGKLGIPQTAWESGGDVCLDKHFFCFFSFIRYFISCFLIYFFFFLLISCSFSFFSSPFVSFRLVLFRFFSFFLFFCLFPSKSKV